MKTRLIAGLLVMLAAAVGSAADHLKIQGIDGSSKAPGKAEWIQVVSYSWVNAKPGVAAHSAGSGCNICPLKVVKRIDKASASLHKSFSDKRRISYLELDLGVERHRLEDVLITSVKPAGTTRGGDGYPLEEIAFSYSKCSYHYVKQKATGKPKVTPTHPLDVKLER